MHLLPRSVLPGAVIAGFALLCVLTARSAPHKASHPSEAISTAQTQCPAEPPADLPLHLHSAAMLYNISVVLSRAPGATLPTHPLYNVSASTTITLQAQQDTHCLAVQMPAGVAATLQHVYLTSDQALDTTAATPTPRLCVCAAQAPPLPLPAAHPVPPKAQECPVTCDEAVTKLPLNNTAQAYMADQWYMVALPERIAAGSPVQLAVVSRPASAFVRSTPYRLPPCADSRKAHNVSAPACSTNGTFWDEAMYGGPRTLAPSVLQRGAEAARFALTVTAPPHLQLLWATRQQHTELLDGAHALNRALACLRCCDVLCPAALSTEVRIATLHMRWVCCLHFNRDHGGAALQWVPVQTAPAARPLRSCAASAPTCWAWSWAACASCRPQLMTSTGRCQCGPCPERTPPTAS